MLCGSRRARNRALGLIAPEPDQGSDFSPEQKTNRTGRFLVVPPFDPLTTSLGNQFFRGGVDSPNLDPRRGDSSIDRVKGREATPQAPCLCNNAQRVFRGMQGRIEQNLFIFNVLKAPAGRGGGSRGGTLTHTSPTLAAS